MVKTGDYYELLGKEAPWNVVKVDEVDGNIRAHVLRPYEGINFQGDSFIGKEEWYTMLDGEGNMFSHIFKQVTEDEYGAKIKEWRKK